MLPCFYRSLLTCLPWHGRRACEPGCLLYGTIWMRKQLAAFCQSNLSVSALTVSCAFMSIKTVGYVFVEKSWFPSTRCFHHVSQWRRTLENNCCVIYNAALHFEVQSLFGPHPGHPILIRLQQICQSRCLFISGWVVCLLHRPCRDVPCIDRVI